MNNKLFIQNSIKEYFAELKKQLPHLENVLNEVYSNMIEFTINLNASSYQEFVNSLNYLNDFVHDYVSNEDTISLITGSVVFDTISILDPLVIYHKVNLSKIQWGASIIKKIFDEYKLNIFNQLQYFLVDDLIQGENYLVDSSKINNPELIELLKVFLEQTNLTSNFLHAFRKFLIKSDNFQNLICYIYPNKFWERLIIDVLNKYNYNISQINFLYSCLIYLNFIITNYMYYRELKKDLFDIICMYKLERVFSMMELAGRLQNYLIKIKFPYMVRKRIMEFFSLLIDSNDESIGSLIFNKLFLATECFYCYEIVSIDEMHFHLSKNVNSEKIKNALGNYSYTYYDFVGCYDCYQKKGALQKLNCFTCHTEIYRRDIPVKKETVEQHLNQLKVLAVRFVDTVLANTNPVKFISEIIYSYEYLDEMTNYFADKWRSRLTFTQDLESYLLPLIQIKLDEIAENLISDKTCVESNEEIDTDRIFTELQLMCPKVIYTNDYGKLIFQIKKDTPVYKHIENQIKFIQEKLNKIHETKKSQNPAVRTHTNVDQFKSELLKQKHTLLNIKQSIFDKFMTFTKWSQKDIKEFKFSLFPGLNVDLPIIIPKYEHKTNVHEHKTNVHEHKTNVHTIENNEEKLKESDKPLRKSRSRKRKQNNFTEINEIHEKPTRKAKLQAKERIKRIYR